VHEKEKAMMGFLKKLFQNEEKTDIPARPWRWPPLHMLNELEEDHAIEEQKDGGD
jgi:hypothetical protein